MTHDEQRLKDLVERTQAQADAMSQVEDHPVLHLLDAAMVLLGVEGFDREKALMQAAGDCQRALGREVPSYLSLRRLLSEAAEQLHTLSGISTSLDDGLGADGQDWSATREAADDLTTRIRSALEGVFQQSPVLTVRVDISGGVAYLVSKPGGVAVELRDYDQDGVDPEAAGLQQDEELEPGNWYTRDYTGPSETP